MSLSDPKPDETQFKIFADPRENPVNFTNLDFKVSQLGLENLLGLSALIQLHLQLAQTLISQLYHVNRIGIVSSGYSSTRLSSSGRQHTINIKALATERDRLLGAARGLNHSLEVLFLQLQDLLTFFF